MTNFEQIGRKVDRQIERLGELAERKMGPRNREKAARSLRGISAALGRLAADLEAYIEPDKKQERSEKQEKQEE